MKESVEESKDIVFKNDHDSDTFTLPISTIKRASLTPSQLKSLECAYRRNPNWSKKYLKRLALRLGLDRTKVYKWHWDRKRRGLGDRQAAILKTFYPGQAIQ